MPEILVLCTGNVCRSPMGEVLLRRHLEERGLSDDYYVHSAGTGVYGHTIDGHFPGYPASERAGYVMARRGMSLEGHRSKRILPDHLDSADLVIAMAREHLRDALNLHPPVADRAFLLKEIAAIASEAPLGGRTFEEMVAELNSRRTSPWDAVALRWEADVDDPIGGDLYEFEACASEIETLIETVAHAFWPAVDDIRVAGDSKGAR